MTIGIALAPANAGNYVDATVTQARAVHELGVGSVWFGQRMDYDSPALAAIVGREIPGLQVGTSAIPVVGRHPLIVASQAQTAQAATHGRYHLGLAVGSSLVAGAFGTQFDHPITRLREFLTAITQLLDTGTADFRGELLTATPTLPTAVPGASPRTPVLVAAMGPQALRVTGELADGTLPYLTGPKTLSEHIIPAITRASATTPRVIAFVPAVVTAEAEAVRAQAIDKLAFYEQVPSYRRVIDLEGATRAAELALIGDEETIAAGIRRYFDAGATEVVLTSTDLSTPEDEHRTWALAGQLAADRTAATASA
ncbi:TIGR03564 family F420-dependent LLM class oxidoreductase [Nocardia yamanashiensis]|uniref:TIGR03564 family F420-dependent LLM class oxidoreductase n=1 Tax=Nocardia yamanashiensis TaxID=209247 RepID=UPI001E4C7767|nr:TIGR03564 family F420-dependent LLM class oxidoreductase [Nocardia yamanashiensis]UGT42738.1 TIGR03564 family F420-dependent LLM class oxidoreductase [Nocardia yamanashiensis]